MMESNLFKDKIVLFVSTQKEDVGDIKDILKEIIENRIEKNSEKRKVKEWNDEE